MNINVECTRVFQGVNQNLELLEMISCIGFCLVQGESSRLKVIIGLICLAGQWRL